MAKELRKKRTGRVLRNTMDKTVIVGVEWRQRHPLYKKSVRRLTKFFAHDGENDCGVGDVVVIEETRPISRLKRWRVVQVVERREVAEVRPIELDQTVLDEIAVTLVREEEASEIEDTLDVEEEAEEEEDIAEEEDILEEEDVLEDEEVAEDQGGDDEEADISTEEDVEENEEGEEDQGGDDEEKDNLADEENAGDEEGSPSDAEEDNR